MGYRPPGSTKPSPAREPTVEVAPTPIGQPTPAPAPQSGHRLGPPGRGEKERKARVGGVGAALVYTALGSVTEGLDTLYAVWDALPRDAKEGWRHAPPHIALRQLYDHYDRVDLEQALHNLFDNAVEDFLFGVAGQYAKKLSKDLGFGLQTGSAYRNKLIQEAVREYQKDRGISREDTTFDPFN